MLRLAHHLHEACRELLLHRLRARRPVRLSVERSTLRADLEHRGAILPFLLRA
eukprot:CAMPEP_0203982154 /NCGR_PEP_ID=MMETSP0360-20130528/2841_1 /ASSEMBLY_ACC=CAM_ASM_000342 /TAXON_ID=268821 /ORGANISM="Scrippsiella Hangoei, Strain SHTV-5" /LENGTH=52 /DNA_ID=CAMNT_0050920865 /DNA_START=258 /DNA_END=412 /DNA_ORIENTATION=+